MPPQDTQPSALKARSRLRDADLQAQTSQQRYRHGRLAIQMMTFSAFVLKSRRPKQSQRTNLIPTHPSERCLRGLKATERLARQIGTDASDPATILGGGRQFSFEQESGDSDIVADYDFHWVITDADDTNVLLYIISLERVSGAVIDATKLAALLLDTTISIENTSEVKQPGRTGGLESIVQAKEFDMGLWQYEGNP